MSKIFCLTALLLAASALGALDCDSFYGSGADQSGDVGVLINSPQGGQFWYLDSQSSPSFATSSAWSDPGWQEGVLEAPAHPYAGFLRQGASPLAVPIYFPTGGISPSYSRSLPLENDNEADDAFGLPHLDLLHTQLAFSETRLYYYLKCNTMTYPVSSGFTFYSYMGVLSDPNATPGEDPLVWALMNTVTAPGIISPGLYKITGNGTEDLLLLAPIEISVDETAGALVLSCALSDLLADADFAAWFDPDYPLASTVAMTSRITLSGGNVVADTTAGTQILLQPKQINPGNLFAPVVSNFVPSYSNGQLSVQADYSDPDHNYPQNPSFSLDGGVTWHPLHPVGLQDFSQTVSFSGGPVSAPPDWLEASFSFVNGGVAYTYDFPNPGVTAEDELLPPVSLKTWPNPARDILKVSGSGFAPLVVYNQRGQKLRELALPGKEAQLDLSGLAPGVYLLRQGAELRRFLKL